MEVDDKTDKTPVSNPSDGEEVEQEDNLPRKSHGKKHRLFGGIGGNATWQDEVEDVRNDEKYESREGESVYDSPGGHRHTHRHKKFRRYHSESSNSTQHKHDTDMEQDEGGYVEDEGGDVEDEGGDVEDGEILEDGEIADDDEEEEAKPTNLKKSPGGESNKSSPGSSREHRHSHRRERHYEEEKEREGTEGGEEEIEKSRKDKKKKKKSKKDRHERKERDKKRRRHGRDYKDPDHPDDQDIVSFDKRSRSPPGSYEGQIYESPPSPYDKSSHHHSPSKKRGSPGQYDYHYDSPPGLYDSPSYDEDSEEGTPGLMRNASGGGYDGEYMDPDSQQHHSRKRKAGHSSRSRRRSEEGQINMPPRKKPLLEIPRHERPHCKFYMEGKCAKGLNCPFNHDFRPPRKPEICKFYLLSTCSKGEFCIFMHGDYPCKYFHTGAECYQGDNCKFSHDPLTDETRPLLEKLLHSDENDKPRPCLLGSPPRHLLEGGADPTKKIPSLFDIEVFPPGQNNSPRKPAPSSPSVRPSGYYKDPNSSTQAPGAGPPGNGPQLGQVPPVLNMIGAMLRRAPPDVVARAGAPNQGPPGMHGPRMHGPGMGPPPRGPYMGPGSSPDPRDNRGPGGPPDMRGPGPNFHRGPPPHMDQGGPMGPGGPMFDPRGPTMDQDPRGPQPGMMPGMDARGPPPGMDPRGMPPGMNQRGPNSMDPRGPPPGMDPRGPQMRMDPRDPRSQGMEQRDSRDPRSVDQRSSQMDPRDPRNQNMNSAGQEVPRTNSMDPRNQKLDPRDPRNQNNDSSESRDLQNNCDPRPQRGLLPDPPGIEKIIDPRQNYSEPRNVPFISKDPRSKVSNSRDPRSATIDRQDSQLYSAQSPPYEKDSVSEATATSDQRSGDISPGHESNMSPASHRDEKMEAIKSDVGGSDVSVKDGAVKMDDKIQDLNQDSQDTQDLSQEFLGERKEDEATTLEIASHLPPTQRNLFLRIRQQQHNLENPSDQGETTETSDDATPTVKGAESQDVEDDDWYSSDEDGGDAPKLMDVLKNLNKQPVPPPSSTASTINIMQMIQSIKNQAPTDKPSILSPSLTENLKQESPKRRSSTDTMKNSTPTKEVLHDHSSSTLSVNSYLSGAYPVIEAVLTSMTYRAKEFTLTDRKPYSTLPSHVDSKDPSYLSDPRVQKYISRMGKIKPPMSSPLNGETQAAKPASIDPRRARHLSIEEKTACVSAPAAGAPKPLDPRVRRADPRTPADQPNPTIALATLEKAVSEQIAKALDSRGSDPRLQRVQSTPNPAMHNLPVRPVKDPRQDPRLGQAVPPPGSRPDPRGMNRQHSLDGRMNDPRNAPPFLNNEPRMGFDPRMGVGPDVRPPFDNRMPFNSRMPFGPGPGPRMGPGPMPRMPFGARMGGPDARMPFDPRMGPDQRMHNEGLLGDPRAINDPRSGGDPRSSGPGDPRSSGQGLIGDPRMGTGPVNDPRSGPPVKSDPRSNNKTDPRLANDPRSGDDPRSQGLQRTNSDPRSANADSSRQTGSIPAALLEPPKISSSDNANTSESESGWSDSQSGDQSGKRFDYRNDPRFKRKPASDTSEKGILVKKFTGQRKSSMEYSSPLGMDDSKSDGSSGYNSYNRPNPNQNKIPQKVGPWSKGSNNSPGGNSGSPSHPGQTVVPDISQQTGGLDPPVLPNLMNPPQVPLPNEPPLKDLFKSIDPTASPFC